MTLVTSQQNPEWKNFETLSRSIDNNVEFLNNKQSKSEALHLNLLHLKNVYEKCCKFMSEVRKFAGEYDFDEHTPGNGFRSFLSIFDSAIRETSIVCDELIRRRAKLLFRADNYAKKLDQWTQIFGGLSQIAEHLIELHQSKNDRNLFSDSEGYENILTRTVEDINAKVFYGENIGFQYFPSVRPAVAIIVISLASYYNFYFKESAMPLRLLKLSNSFIKYFLNPKHRAEKYINALENSTTEFCQSFWSLSEARFAHVLPSSLACKAEVNKIFQIPSEPLQIYSDKYGRMVNIPVPSSHTGLAPISCRLLSTKKRNGMIDENATEKGLSPSKCLIFHVHGGGWASQTSKSHESYLREWASKLDVPILSIDYSLAPQAPFPRALEEVFYAYCWALKNPELVGSTGENIVFVGDSAGGNLNTGCLIKCIEMGIRKPKGIVDIYTPFWVGFNVTPARFLSCIDPVLPFGFTSRLCKSYAQIPEVTLNEKLEESNEPGEKKKKRRIRYESFAEEFNVKVHDSPLISPYLASDEVLTQFPTVKLVATSLDPCLDDSIEFAKKMKKLNVDVQLDVLSGLPHGFLYLTQFSKECHDASMVCMERMKSVLEI